MTPPVETDETGAVSEARGPTRFRKKPIEVDAMLFDGSKESAQAIAEWVGLDGKYDREPWGPGWLVYIGTREGIMIATAGDYVIREPFPTADRKFYPCKPSIFTATYEPIWMPR